MQVVCIYGSVPCACSGRVWKTNRLAYYYGRGLLKQCLIHLLLRQPNSCSGNKCARVVWEIWKELSNFCVMVPMVRLKFCS